MVPQSSLFAAVPTSLRRRSTTWGAAFLLPLPALLTIDPERSAEPACLYLGLSSAWLACEILGAGGLPKIRSAWLAKSLEIAVAVFFNTAAFIALGLAIGVRANLPFPAMASLSAVPAVGLVPWLMLRLRRTHAALVLGAVMVGGAKIAGCIVARAVYGPTFAADGRIAADWDTAAVMISTFWALTTCLSLLGLVMGGRRCPNPACRVQTA
jgi:hypothetical protein